MISNRNNTETANICIDLPESYINNAIEAVKQWDAALQNWIQLAPIVGITGNKCWVTIQETDAYHKSEPSAIAWADKVGGEHIYIRRPADLRTFKMSGIILHELGHVFGAQHVPNTLMSKTISFTWRCPDAVTVAQVAAWNHIDIDMLSWCN